MIYRMCERKIIDDEETLVVLSDIVTPQEFKAYYAEIGKLRCFDRIDFFLKMIRYNGALLSKILLTSSTKSKKETHSILEQANKYIFDFACSIGSFVEYVEKQLIPQKSKQQQEEFAKYRKTLFDDDIYKFWYYMRNYVVHYDVPFTQITAKLIDDKSVVEIICHKQHILKYKEWKHAKNYINTLPEIVDIAEMINPILVILHAYYLQLLFILRDEVIAINKYASNFILMHKAREGVCIMSYKSEEDYIKNHQGHIHVLYLDKISRLMKDLSIHPNVNIKFTQIVT